MLEMTLEALLGLATVIGLVAAAVTAVVGASLMIWPLRAKLLRGGLETYLYHVRQRDYVNKGVDAGGRKLKRYVRLEVDRFLQECPPSWPYTLRHDALPVWLVKRA